MHPERLLERIEHATVATVSSSGQPWNTPVYFARTGGEFFWISRADAQHSINIRQNGRAFIVVYDSSREDASGAAVYVDAEARELTDAAAIANAVVQIYRRRKENPPTPTSFDDASPQRVYVAIAQRAWTNIVHAAGDCPWDERVDISLVAE
jgi:nitroimidazol reductase NimA-like FMN-containing flavoprotein (pyridoxamine 5'-phosphate oxidase superfamily)